jgi:hypothetical protein
MSDFTLDDIYVYIFSWKHVTNNAVALYQKISPYFPRTTLINCDENSRDLPISASNIIQLDDRYYYGGQFHTAINNTPPGKILACVVGDVSPDADWAGIARNAVVAFNRKDIGIYAPNVYYTYWTLRGANIAGELFDVENTDCTCWFLHPILTDSFRSLDYFGLSNFGWGIDKIYCGGARAAGLHVARDYSKLVTQPKGTAYSEREAGIQMQALIAAHDALRDNTNKSQ